MSALSPDPIAKLYKVFGITPLKVILIPKKTLKNYPEEFLAHGNNFISYVSGSLLII